MNDQISRFDIHCYDNVQSCDTPITTPTSYDNILANVPDPVQIYPMYGRRPQYPRLDEEIISEAKLQIDSIFNDVPILHRYDTIITCLDLLQNIAIYSLTGIIAQYRIDPTIAYLIGASLGIVQIFCRFVVAKLTVDINMSGLKLKELIYKDDELAQYIERKSMTLRSNNINFFDKYIKDALIDFNQKRRARQV